MYDAAHVAILMAGGVFQQPLENGADLMTMSTHKAFGGPVGGVILTNDENIAAPILHRTVNGFIQTRDANKLVAAAYAAAEATEFAASVAKQMVRNARAFAAALETHGFKPLAAGRGYTETHHVILDVSEEGPARVRNACMSCNILVQGARLPKGGPPKRAGVSDTTRTAVVDGDDTTWHEGSADGGGGEVHAARC